MSKTRARRVPKVRRHKGPVPFTSVEFPDGSFVATRDRKKKKGCKDCNDVPGAGAIEFLANSGVKPKAIVEAVLGVLADAKTSAQFARWLARAAVILRGKDRVALQKALTALLTAADKGHLLDASQAALDAAKIVSGRK